VGLIPSIVERQSRLTLSEVNRAIRATPRTALAATPLNTAVCFVMDDFRRPIPAST
jgi:hypothetical protein